MGPIITTPLCTIRPFCHDDLTAFAAYRAVPEVAQYQSWSDYSYQDALAMFEDLRSKAFGLEGQWYQLALADPQSDALLGDLALHFVDGEQMEIGFTLAPAHQGKGIAGTAVMALLDYLFNELHKHRVIAVTDTENTPSWRLLERLGFRREGHYRQNIFFKGAWGDEFQYAMLRDEFSR